MTEVTLFQTGFRMDDSALQPGDIFRKAGGTVWLVNPDESQTQISGTSPPHTSIIINLTGTADTDGVNFTCSKQSGDDLLDFTDPTQPVVLIAGVYAISGDYDITDSLPIPAVSIEAATQSSTYGNVDSRTSSDGNGAYALPTLIQYFPESTVLSFNFAVSDGTLGMSGTCLMQRIS